MIFRYYSSGFRPYSSDIGDEVIFRHQDYISFFPFQFINLIFPDPYFSSASRDKFFLTILVFLKNFFGEKPNAEEVSSNQGGGF